MTHLTPLQLSMHADNALSAEESLAITRHVESCAACQTQLAAMQQEAGLIASALHVEAPDELREIPAPGFAKPASLRGFALANLTAGLVIWLGQFLWKTIFGELVMNATTWVTSVYLPDTYAMASAAALYLLEEGTTMFDAYLGFVVVSLSAITALWLVLKYRRSHTPMGVCMLVMVAATLVAPAPAAALEIRRSDDLVTVAKSETIDDTLIVATETARIEGVITGDLIVFGRRVDITGTVEGNLVTFAQSITIRGQVGGFALGATNTYDMRGATVGGDLWVAGERAVIDNQTSIGRNAAIATESTVVEGAVAKDLYAFAETVELSGNLDRNLEVFANRLRLLGDARVGGDVRFRTDSKDQLYQDDTVQVEGAIEFLDMPEELKDESRYASFEFYLWQVARLIAAFIVGMGILWLLPGFRSLSLTAGMEAVKTAGVGFLTLIFTPVLAVLVAFTLVGLPLSLITLATWLIGIYLAKVLVGVVVGRMLLSERTSTALPLLAGLAIVIVAVNLPFIGGFVNFVLTLIGLGLFVQYLIGTFQARDSGDLNPA